MFVDVQAVVADAIQENEMTRRVIEALPDNKHGYRPGSGGRTAGELAWHLLTGRAWFLAEVVKLPLSDRTKLALAKQPAKTEHMLESLDALMVEQLEHVRGKDEYWLREDVDFFGRSTTIGAMLYQMVKHEAHHRGQLTSYLRAIGAKVPGVYGPSADEA